VNLVGLHLLKRGTACALALAVLHSVPAYAAETSLWRDFLSGMTPEQVAAVAATMPGVKSARVKTEDGMQTVAIKHGGSAKFEVAEKQVRLSFSFRNGGLFGVHLTPEPNAFGGLGCMSSGAKSFFYFDEILSAKYQLLYEERYADNDLDRMASAARLAKLTRDLAFRLPINRLLSKFSDGQNVVINEASFSYLPMSTYDMCEREGSIHGRGSLSYYNKAEYDAVIALQDKQAKEKTKELSDDL
jgi:hypothetical protein